MKMRPCYSHDLIGLAGLLLAVTALPAGAADAMPADWTQDYDVVWTTPSRDAAGSMPLGNGVVGVNLWVEQGGDLVFYISRNDALSEVSQLCKVGRVRIALAPSPLAAGAPFRQALRLRDGVCEITFGDAAPGRADSAQAALPATARTSSAKEASATPAGSNSAKEATPATAGRVTLRVFVDADSPVVHVVGESASPVSVKATVESWRTERHSVPRDGTAWSVHNGPFELFESADVFPAGLKDAVAWYHRNEQSTAFTSTIQVQSLQSIADKTRDPLLGRTFGGWLTGAGLAAAEGHAIATAAPVRSFALRVAAPCAQTPTAQAWLDEAQAVARESGDAARAMLRTAAWWRSFWERSWVIADGPRPAAPRVSVGAAYTLQRYMMACAGRGPIPIKFNGSIFTVEPKAMGQTQSPDWRRWGDCHWWQNVRLPYHPMLAGGDFEMMEPLLAMYEAARPLCEARAKLYHGAEGCYFPETMTIWGTYANGDYAWDRAGKQPKDVASPWWQYAWNQGPELVALMLDRWDYTRDEAFLKGRVLPMAESVLKYFDTRFRKDAQGRIVLDPTQSVETFWYEVTNDMPTAAGLNAVTARLCALPETMTTPRERAFFAKMKSACPAVPVEEAQVGGQKVRRLAPAEKYRNQRSNCENPELYAIWPFRLFGLGKPGLDEARAAYATRANHLDKGWGYDGNCAALLGMADEAARILKVKLANSHPAYRWPATWGPNFDWLPDQDHGSNLMLTTQLMLLQCDGDVIRLLPAWPKDWDVSFKLHAPGNTTVECVYRGGNIEKLEVTPAARRKDVVDCRQGATGSPGKER